MGIYQDFVNAVYNGERFNVDLSTKTASTDNGYFIRNGHYDGDLGKSRTNLNDCLSEIETLFEQYKFSMPSERSEKKKATYFQPLKIQDIPSDMLLIAVPREVAQAVLEMYLLCSVLNGSLDEFRFSNKYYWQSELDKDLVIMKDWL